MGHRDRNLSKRNRSAMNNPHFNSPSSRALLLLATVLFLHGCTSYSIEKSTECTDVASLRSADLHWSTEAVPCIYRRGRKAIPDLVEELGGESYFHGWWCGSCGPSSESIPVDWDAPASGIRGHLVSEVALYLIEAIVRGRIHFAGYCKVYVDDKETIDLRKVKLRLRGIARSLQRLTPREQRSLTLEDLLGVKDKYGLSFPGHCHRPPEGRKP